VEREIKRLEAQAESDDKKEEEKREDIMLRHNKASEYVQGRLTQRSGFFSRALGFSHFLGCGCTMLVF
jgi:hypothetical protein